LLSELSINNQTEVSQLVLKKLGFRLGPSGIHIGRTLMLEELRALFYMCLIQIPRKAIMSKQL
jgi:hypothetical protein